MLEDDGERTRPRVAVRQIGVVIWHVQADDKDGDEVEEHDSPEDIADNLGQVLRGVLGLTGCDGNGFGAAAVIVRFATDIECGFLDEGGRTMQMRP